MARQRAFTLLRLPQHGRPRDVLHRYPADRGLLSLARMAYEWKLGLWVLMLLAPFPYIATIFGWMTAELGRQPWVVYSLMRTAQGASPHVSGGNAMFTLIGFFGMYSVLSILFLFLVYLEVQRGPLPEAQQPLDPPQTAAAR